MKTALERSIASRSATDFAAHLSSQLLGCIAELQAIGRVLVDERPLSKPSPEGPLPGEILISLGRVVNQLRRLGHTTLSLSGSLGPDQLFSLAPLDLKTLVEEVVDGFRSQGVDGRLQIRCRTTHSQVWWGQPEQLKMVLESLINLLLYYASLGSRPTITLEEYHGYLERDNGYLLVSIANPDIFIQPAEVEQLFIKSPPEQSFERLSAGLNLYVSRKLIEIHGGQLEAETAANGGLTFWFALPLVEYSEERCERC